MKRPLRFSVLIFLVLAGCESGSQKSTTSDPCELRFEQITSTPWFATHLALDRHTGRMCRTWDWMQPNTYGISSENTPTCDSLK
jgi:hypothetical protein